MNWIGNAILNFQQEQATNLEFLFVAFFSFILITIPMLVYISVFRKGDEGGLFGTFGILTVRFFRWVGK